eukprot:g14764.t1
MNDLNKSCDQCGSKKRRCPGGMPCSRCAKAAETCTFSKRRPRTPSSQVAAQRLRRIAASSLLAQYAKPSLKRCRWSASPATGLVGLPENEFLCDFFGSAGFMPLASPSGVRETLIKIMMAPRLEQPRARARQHRSVEDAKIGASLPEGDFGQALFGRQLPVGPSSCTFWCTVATGALAKGRPVDSVATYVRLAREAIASFSGPANPEVVKAWASFGFLHGFMGDQDTFHEYVQLVVRFLGDTEATAAMPVGFAEMFRVGETIKIFAEDVDPAERKSLLAQELARPKLGNLAGEGEICRSVWQSARLFEQAIRVGLFLPPARAVSDEDAGDCQLGDADDDHASEQDLAYDEPLGVEIKARGAPFVAGSALAEPRPDRVTAEKVDLIADLLQFRLLERVAESPSMRDGMCGLIINDHLFFERVAKGDAAGALEKASRCIDVLERYPGLCRFKLGAHKAHIMTGILVVLGSPRSRQLYAKLRAIHNLTRPAGIQHIPPLEEWRGVSSFCGKMTCRSAEVCGTMAFASSLQRGAVIGQQRVRSNELGRGQGQGSTEHKQTKPSDKVQTFARMCGKSLAADSDFPPEVGRTVLVESDIGGNGQGARRDCGDASRIKFKSNPLYDLELEVPRAAETFALSSGTLGDGEESESDAVAAEDWLEVTHAMMYCSEGQDETFA